MNTEPSQVLSAKATYPVTTPDSNEVVQDMMVTAREGATSDMIANTVMMFTAAAQFLAEDVSDVSKLDAPHEMQDEWNQGHKYPDAEPCDYHRVNIYGNVLVWVSGDSARKIALNKVTEDSTVQGIIDLAWDMLNAQDLVREVAWQVRVYPNATPAPTTDPFAPPPQIPSKPNAPAASKPVINTVTRHVGDWDYKEREDLHAAYGGAMLTWNVAKIEVRAHSKTGKPELWVFSTWGGEPSQYDMMRISGRQVDFVDDLAVKGWLSDQLAQPIGTEIKCSFVGGFVLVQKGDKIYVNLKTLASVAEFPARDIDMTIVDSASEIAAGPLPIDENDIPF